MEALLAIIGFFGLLFLIIMYSALAWGYVLSILYGWFIIPIFPQLPHDIPLMGFIGIAVFVGAITHKTSTSIKDEYKDKSYQWVDVFLSPWLTLFGAWVIHLFY
jgi:hypothetical protein